MKILIIIENKKLKKWHLDCIKILRRNKNKVFFYNFNYNKKINYNYFFYYLFKFINNPKTEDNIYQNLFKKNIVKHDTIQSDNGNIFKLTQNFKDFCKKKKIDLIIRFGLGIIKNDIKIPILSFHHGDPNKYRGRPSGLYELFNNERIQGQVVQILSSKLDAGKILSYGETKVDQKSYKNTLFNSYSISYLLLEKAISSLKKKNILNQINLVKFTNLPQTLNS